jgi:DNA (cytosine-5)-methyltransferase 1
MTHGSLFSGIGGFDLASEWMGWENKFHCELNEFGQKVLHYYWPESELFTDIKKADFTKYENKIDVLSGGFPCQPFSLAGSRKGSEDDRHLWPEMLRAIKEIKPNWVVGENVHGIINWNEGMVFQQVQSDLENNGYEVKTILLPAASVNAPHKRNRVYFIANSNNQRRCSEFGCIQKENGEVSKWNNDAKLSNASNEYASNTECKGLEGQCRERQGCTEYRSNKRLFFRSENKFDVSSNTNGIGLRRESNWIGESGFFGQENKENNWKNFPTISPICSGDDGISSRLDFITFPKWRKESLKGYGNAVVPQVIYQIFKTIQEYERIRNTKENS